MSKNKLGQEPAFPSTDGRSFANEVMSKRFYAACAAMQGILASWDRTAMPEEKGIVLAIKVSYECADELLKQENL